MVRSEGIALHGAIPQKRFAVDAPAPIGHPPKR